MAIFARKNSLALAFHLVPCENDGQVGSPLFGRSREEKSGNSTDRAASLWSIIGCVVTTNVDDHSGG